MVYSNKFVMCVLLNGRPQKELANGVVPLPFGAEYVLRFRNKNNRRAVVQIYIDGENVSGAGYIVNANDYVDIKRHHDVDRAFKFVSLDSEDAIDYGKNGPNDDKSKGTIEARFFLEKEQPQVVYRNVHEYVPRPKPIFPYHNPDIRWTCDAGQGQAQNLGGLESMSFGCCDTGSTTKGLSSGGIVRTSSMSAQSRSIAPPEQLEDGCTVEGHITGQSFRTVWCDTEETYTSVKIFLQGFEEEVPAAAPIKKQKAKFIGKPKKSKSNRIDDLEDENEKLRREIEELKAKKRRKEQKEAKEKALEEQNEKLKKELEELKS